MNDKPANGYKYHTDELARLDALKRVDSDLVEFSIQLAIANITDVLPPNIHSPSYFDRPH